MHNKGARSMKGNDAFEGYAVDLIKEVAKILSEQNTNTIVIRKLNDLL